MGYRQDYKFIIVGTQANLDKVVLFIEELATRPQHTAGSAATDDYSEAVWAKDFLDKLKWLGHPDVKLGDRYALLIEDEDIKAYGMFDAVVDSIIAAAAVHGCQTQYAHVGDELSDNVTKGESEDVTIYISRNIEVPEW